MKHLIHLGFVWLIVVGLMVGCGQAGGGGDAANAGVGVPADAAFKVTGMVDAGRGWTVDQLKAMTMADAELTNKEGETESYSGVPINDLLDEAGVSDGAATVTLVASDGYSVDVALDELTSCASCIIAIGDDDSLRSALPGFPRNTGVKDIVEMQVK